MGARPRQHLDDTGGVEPAVDEEALADHPDDRQHEEDDQDQHRSQGQADEREVATTAHLLVTSLQSRSHSSRCSAIAAGSMAKGCSGRGANCAQSGGNAAPASTGKTYIEPGSASWNVRVSMKSISASAPFGLAAPASTPAYSTCWKQVLSRALVLVPPLPSVVNAGEES